MHQQPMQLFHLCMIHQMLEKHKPWPLLSHRLWLWTLFQMWCLCQTLPFHLLYKLMYRNLSACTRCFVPCANFACCSLFGTTARPLLACRSFCRQQNLCAKLVVRRSLSCGSSRLQILTSGSLNPMINSTHTLGGLSPQSLRSAAV